MSRKVPTLSDSEYLAIEEAIAATPKGRAFLRRRDKIGRVVGIDTVGELVRGLKDWIAGGDTGADRESLEVIRSELTSVRAYIDQAKSEISDLVADDSPGGGRIQGATAELDEIVSATAQATNDILTAAEAINSLALELPPELATPRDQIGQRCMDVFQACSFQDITGQRIAKVVRTLTHVEERVNAMIAIGELHGGVSPPDPAAAKTEAASAGPVDESALLNGPQLPGLGLDQAAIDALLTKPAANGAGTPANAAAKPSGAALAASDKAEPLCQSAIDALFG